jgi:hypothetical protein
MINELAEYLLYKIEKGFNVYDLKKYIVSDYEIIVKITPKIDI